MRRSRVMLAAYAGRCGVVDRERSPMRMKGAAHEVSGPPQGPTRASEMGVSNSVTRLARRKNAYFVRGSLCELPADNLMAI